MTNPEAKEVVAKALAQRAGNVLNAHLYAFQEDAKVAIAAYEKHLKDSGLVVIPKDSVPSWFKHDEYADVYWIPKCLVQDNAEDE